MSSFNYVMHLGLLFAATTMAASIFTMMGKARAWTPAFMLKRLTKCFPDDDAASLIFALGLNHSMYSVTESTADKAVGFRAAYYINDHPYAEHPLHVPLKEGERFRSPQKITICGGNSSLEKKVKKTCDELSKHLTLATQEYETYASGICELSFQGWHHSAFSLGQI